MSSVDQLIFTRVEPPYSPKRESGYQVVYRSNGIASAEVDEVRRAVEAFAITRGLETPPRWQYFVLSTQRIVIAQSHAIDTDNDIMDRTGRKGIFLAHCFVFARQLLRSVDNNPFVVFDRLLFASTTDDLRNLITCFGKATGIAGAQDIDLHPITLPTHRWNNDELQKLVRLASDAGKTKAAGKTVLMVGTQEDILEGLRVALHFASNKLECTFNTNIDRMQTPPLGVYWAVGVSIMQSGPNFIVVNASERRVVSPVDFTQTTDLYQIWFDEMTRLGRISDRDQYAQVIQVLSEHFRLRRIWLSDDIKTLAGHEEALKSFKSVHRDLILRRVRNAITKHIPANLTLINELLFFFDKHVAVIYTLCVAVPSEISPAYLIEIAFRMLEIFQVDKGSLKSGDWNALCQLAILHKHEQKSIELAFWSAAFLDKDGNKLRVRALQMMQPEQYEQVVKKLGNPFNPTDFVAQSMSPKLLLILFGHLTRINITDELFISLIEAVLAAGFGSTLDRLPESLLQRINLLTTEHLGRIERSLNNTFAPPMFTAAVEARRAQLPQPQNILQRTFSKVKNRYAVIATKAPRTEINRRTYHDRPGIHGESLPETRVQPDKGIPKTDYQEKRKPEMPLSATKPFQTTAHPARDEEETQRPLNRGVRANDEQSIKANQEQDNDLQNDAP